jgi:hypothetical protein
MYDAEAFELYDAILFRTLVPKVLKSIKNSGLDLNENIKMEKNGRLNIISNYNQMCEWKLLVKAYI